MSATNRSPITAAPRWAAYGDKGAADLSNAPAAQGQWSRVATIRRQEG